jgi:archaellum biogenesis ATPase FlaH
MKIEEARVDRTTEVQLIADIIQHPAIMESRWVEKVLPEYFGVDANRFCWEGLVRLHKNRQPIGLVSFKRAMEGRKFSKAKMEEIVNLLGRDGTGDTFAARARGQDLVNWSHFRERSKLLEELTENGGADYGDYEAILKRASRHETAKTDDVSWLRRGYIPTEIDLVPFSEMPEPKEDDEVITSGLLIKQGITLLTGPSKVGKSYMVLEMARALTTGTSFLQSYPVKSKQTFRVAYIQGELSDSQLFKRMKRLQMDNDKLLVHKMSGQSLSLNTEIREMGRSVATEAEKGLIALGEAVKRRTVDVLIFDPLYCFLSGSELDEIAMKSAFSNLQLLSEITNTAIVLVHHNRKTRPGDRISAEMASGHSVLNRAPIAIMTIAEQYNDSVPAAQARIRCRFQLRCHEPIGDVEIKQNAGTWFATPFSSDGMSAVFEVLNASPQPLKIDEIMDATGMSNSACARYLKKLTYKKDIQHQKPFYWVEG